MSNRPRRPRPSFNFTEAGQHERQVPCPYCGHGLDGYTGITGDATPEPGDASLCVYCAGLLVFAEDLTPREPTEAELPELLESPELMTAQRAARKLIARRSR